MKFEFRPTSELTAEIFADCWAKWVPAKYRVDAEILRYHGPNHPCYLFDHSYATLRDGEVVGFYGLKDSASQLYEGPSAKDLHIQAFAFESHEVGVTMMEHLKGDWEGSGRTFFFGRGHGHLFPGVPTDWPEMAGVLKDAGFDHQPGSAFDVEADLADHVFEADTPDHVAIRQATVDDHGDVDRFFREEFPGRWRFDTLARLVANPSDVVLLKVDGRVEGFAFLQGFFSPMVPVAGGVWRHSLGSNWGALGPIGVSKGVRGQKLGGALLAKGLQILKENGVRRCIIDWTTLTEFYGKFGFVPTREYETYTLTL